MQVSKEFQKTIEEHLKNIASTDPKFKEKFESKKKNIQDCTTYILNTVKKSGKYGFADADIFGMALHYYDEEKIDVGKPINAKVVVNRPVKDPVKKKSTGKSKSTSIKTVKTKPVIVDKKGQTLMF